MSKLTSCNPAKRSEWHQRYAHAMDISELQSRVLSRARAQEIDAVPAVPDVLRLMEDVIWLESKVTSAALEVSGAYNVTP